MSKVGECAGLPFQQAISEVRIKINKKGVQRYRNRTFLRDYIVNVVGNNIHEINDGYNWYKAGALPSKLETNTVADLRTIVSYSVFTYVCPVHVDLVAGVPGNIVAFNEYIIKIFDLYRVYPDIVLVDPLGFDIVNVHLVLDGGGNPTNLAAFNAYLFNLNAVSNALQGQRLYVYVPYIVTSVELVNFNNYLNEARNVMKSRGITPTGSYDIGHTLDTRNLVIADADWRNNSQYVSDLVQFNQTSRCYNENTNVVDNNQVNSMATYTKMSPLFAPPFTHLGKVHGSIRGDQEL